VSDEYVEYIDHIGPVRELKPYQVVKHEGVLRKSGRYPWGSGDTPHQRNKAFLDHVETLKRQGLSETQIAQGMGISTTQLRASKAIAKDEQNAAKVAQAQRLKATGMSNVAIGDEMNINESSVRALLDPAARARRDEVHSVADMLKESVDKKGLIDIGVGVENQIGVSETKLKTAVAMLEEQGYQVYKRQVEQLGTGKQTTVKVLAGPDAEYKDVYNKEIHSAIKHSPDGGATFEEAKPPKNIDSKRIEVRYSDDGGAAMDGVIQVRRGVDDISLGKSRYAQVRIAVDGTHYLKGMAMYADDLPHGVDLRFNTNKSKAEAPNKLDAMKKQDLSDPLNPFGAVIKPGGQRGVMNIVNEEGDWGKWSKNLSSQMLSKQSPMLAKQQLDLAFKRRQDEYEEIMALQNPAIRKKLLETFADTADSSAVHLKAAALPRQGTQVILPINSLKDHEIYAPNFRPGERVVLVRYPHGGTFEMPELVVNNSNKEARSVLSDKVNGHARDAVGINARVAERLSGADFDGDTVLVIPNDRRSVKTSPALKELKDFDPKKMYPAYPGMKVMSDKQKQMGDVSNLITDMTILGANQSEIARAVRHSMVVIDAEKHKLNYKQSAIDNNIKDLKAKYQGASNAGAYTLISKATSQERVLDRKPRPAKDGGPVDPNTGEKVYVRTGEGYTKTTVSKRTGEVTEKWVDRTQRSTKMAEAKDATSLISSKNSPMERVYADHANKLKALANQSRKEALQTPPVKYSPSSNKVYASEVASLKSKLNTALRNKPLERQAQLIANAQVKAKVQAKPDMDPADLKKIRNLAQKEARLRTGAEKSAITFTEKEWEAVQSGAISNHMLVNILKNADLEQVKGLANPRAATTMLPAKIARAKAMLATGHTQSEIADQLGVSTSVLSSALNVEGE
jgi:DNA-binding CsgD family transcriptional regulator